MKKVAILLALFCMLTVTASAAYIPEDVISENRDGRQLIVKTYMLPPDADPSGLVEEPFEVEGYSYHHLETVKEEQTFEDSKIQTEVVTLETDADDLAAILEQLDASMEYNKDGYSGVLTLQSKPKPQAIPLNTIRLPIPSSLQAWTETIPPMSLLLLSKTEAP